MHMDNRAILLQLLKRLKTDRALRFRLEKWWWVLHLPAVALLYFFWPVLWDKASILYLALVSIYALVITAAGGPTEPERPFAHLADHLGYEPTPAGRPRRRSSLEYGQPVLRLATSRCLSCGRSSGTASSRWGERAPEKVRTKVRIDPGPPSSSDPYVPHRS